MKQELEQRVNVAENVTPSIPESQSQDIWYELRPTLCLPGAAALEKCRLKKKKQ